MKKKNVKKMLANLCPCFGTSDPSRNFGRTPHLMNVHISKANSTPEEKAICKQKCMLTFDPGLELPTPIESSEDLEPWTTVATSLDLDSLEAA